MSSDDDSDAPIISTQMEGVGINLDDTLRQRRETAMRQRQEQIERRHKERERQIEENKRKQMRGNNKRRSNNSDDDDDASSAGSADLLAGASPLPSPPSSPSPPNCPGGVGGRNYNHLSKKITSSNAVTSPLSSASAKVNSSNRHSDTSPSSILKYSKKKNGGMEDNNKRAATTSVKWKPKYNYDSSDDDEQMKDNFVGRGGAFKGGRNSTATANATNHAATTNFTTSNDYDPTKVTSERRLQNAKQAAAKRFGNTSDSDDSSDDGFEAMKKAMRKRKEEAEAKKAALATKKQRSPSPEKKASSPAKKMDMNVDDDSPIRRRPAVAKGRSKFAQLAQDSDDDSGEDDMLAGFRAMKAKKEAEERARKEAARKHNPMALEKYEREKLEERRRNSPMKNGRLDVDAGGELPSFEGTEIVLGDDAEVKSISDFGDDFASRRGSGKGDAAKGDGFISTKPSRGMYKRRGKSGDSSDDGGGDSPNKKQRSGSNPNSPNRRGGGGMMQDSEDDGLWDDSDRDEKMKTGNNADIDSDDNGGGGKAKRGRGRKRGSNGPTQPRKRSAKTKSAGSSDDNNSDVDSDVPRPARKAPARKNTTTTTTRRRRRSNSDSDDDGPKNRLRPWEMRYGMDEDEKSDVSEDERERRKSQLKPDFSNPKLGPPGPLVPFVLSKTWKRGDALVGEGEDEVAAEDGEEDRKMPAVPTRDDDEEDIDKVPASMNRYLKGYQREGVQFMYSSVIHGKGCILGDDMGLGKTVQMISLIAALLKKTGTGLDLLEINQHGNKVKKALQKREESKHQALLTGFGIKNDPAGGSALDDIEPPRFSPILIIVPSSVVANWQSEFKTWGHFNVGVYSGASREKALERIKDGLDFILIAAKSLFTRAGDFDQLATVEWKLVVVDEYHEFKNGKSQGYMRLKDIREISGCPIIGMTGTLMQNKHDELYYLIDQVRPGLLGDWVSFREDISKPITYARAKDAKQKVLDMAEEKEQVLRRAIRPAFLERKKEVVLKDELTTKRERVVFCELTEIQKKIYRHILTLPDFQQLRFANAPCDCGVNKQYFRGYKKMKTHREQLDYQRRHKKDLVLKKQCCYVYPWNPRRGEPGEPDVDPEAVLWRQMHEKPIGNPDKIAEDILDNTYICCPKCPTCTALPCMHKLYKVASHPNLLQVDSTEAEKTQKKKLEFAKIALPPDILREMPGGSFYKSDGIMDDHMKLSGKMRTLDYLLTKYLKRRNRVLLFSYSTAALDVIQNHVKCKGWTNMRLDGQTPTNQRQGLVDKFQNDDTEIFLISTKAGGLGLNLTAANKVIIFDVNWNPSYDEQAQDRAFRIGQKRNVDIVRLVARGTIEELIYARQVYKVQLKKQTLGHNTDGKNQPQLFRGVAKDSNRKGELFGLENLLKFKDGSFMSSLWKAADDPNAEHDISNLAEELENCDEDKLDNIAEEGDEGPGDSRTNPKKKSSVDEDDESDGDDSEIEGGINHDDLFAQSKGGAQVAQGDDDFDEEMGGESQIIEVTTKIACEEIASDEDESDEEEIDDPNAATPPDYKTAAVKPEPAPSSSNPEHTTSAEASAASPVKSSAANGEAQGTVQPVPSPVKSNSGNVGEGAATGTATAENDDVDDDDKTVDIQSPVQTSTIPGGQQGALADRSEIKQNQAHSPTNKETNENTADSSDDDMSPDRLRTQPPTMTKKKKKKAAKVQLLGTVFDNTEKNSGKKKSGLYVPSYKK